MDQCNNIIGDLWTSQIVLGLMVLALASKVCPWPWRFVLALSETDII